MNNVDSNSIYNNNTNTNKMCYSISNNITKLISACEYLKDFNYNIFSLQIKYHQLYYDFYSSIERICFLIDDQNSLVSTLQEIENFSKDKSLYDMVFNDQKDNENEQSIQLYKGDSNIDKLSLYSEIILKVIETIILICQNSILNNTNFIVTLNQSKIDIDKEIDNFDNKCQIKYLKLKQDIEFGNKPSFFSWGRFYEIYKLKKTLENNIIKDKIKKNLLIENIDIIKKDFISIEDSIKNYSKKFNNLIKFWSYILKEVEQLKEQPNEINYIFQKTQYIIKNIKDTEIKLCSFYSNLKKNDFKNISSTKIINEINNSDK